MLVPPLFEIHSAPNVLFLFPSSLDGCVVYHISLVAVVFHWAFVLISALAVAALVLLFCVPVSPDDFAVVALDDLLHVLSA